MSKSPPASMNSHRSGPIDRRDPTRTSEFVTATVAIHFAPPQPAPSALTSNSLPLPYL